MDGGGGGGGGKRRENTSLFLGIKWDGERVWWCGGGGDVWRGGGRGM